MLFGMTLRHTREHMYRSALEAVGYSLAEHFSIFEENDIPIHNVYAVGGGTKAPLWMQIISDILGREILTADVTVGAAFGDAVMAAIGAGRFKDFSEIRQYVKLKKIYRPDWEAHEKYQPYFKVFRELYHRNKDLMRGLQK